MFLVRVKAFFVFLSGNCNILYKMSDAETDEEFLEFEIQVFSHFTTNIPYSVQYYFSGRIWVRKRFCRTQMRPEKYWCEPLHKIALCVTHFDDENHRILFLRHKKRIFTKKIQFYYEFSMYENTFLFISRFLSFMLSEMNHLVP